MFRLLDFESAAERGASGREASVAAEVLNEMGFALSTHPARGSSFKL